jgi:hypothetical protein
MKNCDNVNCEFPDVTIEKISDYVVTNAAVLCTGCHEYLEIYSTAFDEFELIP